MAPSLELLYEFLCCVDMDSFVLGSRVDHGLKDGDNFIRGA